MRQGHFPTPRIYSLNAAFLDRRRMVNAARNAGLPLFLLAFLLSACATPPATQYGPAAKPSVPAAPSAPATSVRWNGVFSCTAHVGSKLPALTWTRVPFRQEGD